MTTLVHDGVYHEINQFVENYIIKLRTSEFSNLALVNNTPYMIRELIYIMSRYSHAPIIILDDSTSERKCREKLSELLTKIWNISDIKDRRIVKEYPSYKMMDEMMYERADELDRTYVSISHIAGNYAIHQVSSILSFSHFISKLLKTYNCTNKNADPVNTLLDIIAIMYRFMKGYELPNTNLEVVKNICKVDTTTVSYSDYITYRGILHTDDVKYHIPCLVDIESHELSPYVFWLVTSIRKSFVDVRTGNTFTSIETWFRDSIYHIINNTNYFGKYDISEYIKNILLIMDSIIVHDDKLAYKIILASTQLNGVLYIPLLCAYITEAYICIDYMRETFNLDVDITVNILQIANNPKTNYAVKYPDFERYQMNVLNIKKIAAAHNTVSFNL